MTAFRFYYALLIFISFNTLVNATQYSASFESDIKAILVFVNPGDTIVLENKDWSNVLIKFKASGTKDKPIYLIGRTGGKVVLRGNSRINISGSYLVVSNILFKDFDDSPNTLITFHPSSNNCRLTQSAIIDNDRLQKDFSSDWVNLNGKYNRIDHCCFEGKSNKGQVIKVPPYNSFNYNQVDSNYFNGRELLGENGGEIIQIGQGKSADIKYFTTVKDNYFHKCNGEKEIISNKSSNNIYKSNIFYKSEGVLSLRQGNNCVVELNYFYGANQPRTGGVIVFGEGHRIKNNFFIGLTGTKLYSSLDLMNGTPYDDTGRSIHPAVSNITVSNNIFMNNNVNITFGRGKWKNGQIVLAPLRVNISKNLFINEIEIKAINYKSEVEFECNYFGENFGVQNNSKNIEGLKIISSYSDLLRNESAQEIINILRSSPLEDEIIMQTNLDRSKKYHQNLNTVINETLYSKNNKNPFNSYLEKILTKWINKPIE